MTGWRVTFGLALSGAPRRPDAGDRHQRAAGERGRDYRLYRPVRAAAGENAWRPSAAGAAAAALIGALLLWLSDQVILWLSRVWREVSTGSVTALIGAPLLLWLLPRLRSISAPVMNGGDNVQPERYHVQWFVLAGVALLLLAVSVALAFGRDAHGWLWAHGDLLEQLLPRRWPRVLSALFAGHAGGRRLYYPAPDRQPDGQPGSAGHQLRRGFWRGADAVLRAATPLAGSCRPAAWRGGHLADHYARRRAPSPHRMLLAGMALSTAFTMLLMMLQASGDPRMAQILTWISGSTYSATPERVVRSGAVMLALLALAPLCRRWLTILPLGGRRRERWAWR